MRAALAAFRRQAEPQLQPGRNLIKLDEVLAARDRAEPEQATTMGARRTADENLRRLSALMPLCSTCQFAMTIPADPAAIPVVTDGVGELMAEKHWPKEDVFAVQLALIVIRRAGRARCPSTAHRWTSCVPPHRPVPTVPGRGERAPLVRHVLGGRPPICRQPLHLYVR